MVQLTHLLTYFTKSFAQTDVAEEMRKELNNQSNERKKQIRSQSLTMLQRLCGVRK